MYEFPRARSAKNHRFCKYSLFLVFWADLTMKKALSGIFGPFFSPNQLHKWPQKPPWTPLWLQYKFENQRKGSREIIYIKQNWLKTFKHKFRLKNRQKCQIMPFYKNTKNRLHLQKRWFLALLVLENAHISEKPTYKWDIVVSLRGRTNVFGMRILIYGIILK